MNNYKELLQHPKWQLKRLKIIERDNATCRECSSDSKMLHVHHLKYLNGHKPWEYEDDYLITLCKDCHELEEEYRKHNPHLKDISEMALITCAQCLAFLVHLGFVKKEDNEFFTSLKEELKNKRKTMSDKFDQYHG
jgi:hypothetical protein